MLCRRSAPGTGVFVPYAPCVRSRTPGRSDEA
jgi:hypothetical protein